MFEDDATESSIIIGTFQSNWFMYVLRFTAYIDMRCLLPYAAYAVMAIVIPAGSIMNMQSTL